MKTFVITAKQGFGFNGSKIEPGDELAIVTSNLSPEDLFGWLQFGQAKAVMVKDDDNSELPIADGETFEDSDENGLCPAVESEVTPEPQPDDLSEGVESEQSEQAEVIEETEGQMPSDVASLTAAFIADGLEEKIANTLAEQKVTPDDIRQMISEGFDLEEIDGIGKVRADKIKAIYG